MDLFWIIQSTTIFTVFSSMGCMLCNMDANHICTWTAEMSVGGFIEYTDRPNLSQ